MTAPRVQLQLLRVGHCRHPEWVTLRGGGLRPVEFPAYCALIRHPTAGPILFDTGYADRFVHATRRLPWRLYRWLTPVHLPESQQLSVQLRAHGVAPEEIGLVVLSHLHADHVCGLRDLPRARFGLLRAEADGMASLRGCSALLRGVLPHVLPQDFALRLAPADAGRAVDLGAAWQPFERGFDLLGDGSLLGIPLPGHTPGHLGLLLHDSTGQPVLLAGDAAWSTRAWQEQRPPAFPVRVLVHDWRAYRTTLAGLLQLALRQPELRIVPSHCAAAGQAMSR